MEYEGMFRKSYGMFRKVLESSGKFWKVLESSGMFRKVMESHGISKNLLELSRTCRNVLESFNPVTFCHNFVIFCHICDASHTLEYVGIS